MLEHPALKGFAPAAAATRDVEIDRKARLGDFGSLLPYHTHVDAHDVVAGLNRLIDDAGAGRHVFFDIYTDGREAARFDEGRHGMFFLRGRPGAPFAVIAPGGGFSYVATVHEGLPYALGDQPARLQRVRAALSGRARRRRGHRRPGRGAVDDLPQRRDAAGEHRGLFAVGQFGGGAHGGDDRFRSAASVGAVALPKPAAVVMAYTGHSDTSADEPPTFVVVGEHDRIAPPAVMERRVQALQRAGVMVAYRKVPGLGHGFGLGTGTAAEGWIDDAVRFWERAARQHPSSR